VGKSWDKRSRSRDASASEFCASQSHGFAPGAVQLLEAYGRIGDRVIRRAFLRFAEQVAVTAQRSSRR
jgi:hypothetical protein